MEQFEAVVNGSNRVMIQKNLDHFYLNGSRMDIKWHSPDKGIFKGVYKNKPFTAILVGFIEDTNEIEWRINGKFSKVTLNTEIDLLLKRLGLQNMKSSKATELKSPMPGLILSIEVKPGDTISKGDALLVLESMKMENVIKASSDAVIKSVQSKIGETVEKNEVLIKFEEG